MINISNKKLKLVFLPYIKSKEDIGDKNHKANIKKIKKILNWRPQIDINQGLKNFMKIAKKTIISDINKNLVKYYKNYNTNLKYDGITLSEPPYDDREAKAILKNFLNGNILQGKM